MVIPGETRAGLASVHVVENLMPELSVAVGTVHDTAAEVLVPAAGLVAMFPGHVRDGTSLS